MPQRFRSAVHSASDPCGRAHPFPHSYWRPPTFLLSRIRAFPAAPSRASSDRGMATQHQFKRTLCPPSTSKINSMHQASPNRQTCGRSGDARRPSAFIPREMQLYIINNRLRPYKNFPHNVSRVPPTETPLHRDSVDGTAQAPWGPAPHPIPALPAPPRHHPLAQTGHLR